MAMNIKMEAFAPSTFPSIRLRHALAAAGATLAFWAIIDKHRWRRLDTGGLPPTWFGYLCMSAVRFLRLFKGGKLSSHHTLNHELPRYLSDAIEPRQGPRPELREWPLPQRQEMAPIDPEVHARIFSWTEKFVKENPDLLEYRLSKTEGLSAPAVYVKADLKSRNPDSKDWLLGNEIFHAHPEDSSLHVLLSESDLKAVVSRGYGVRFPMGVIGLLNPGYGFLYAPRTMQECDVVEDIIRASIEFVTGQKPVES